MVSARARRPRRHVEDKIDELPFSISRLFGDTICSSLLVSVEKITMDSLQSYNPDLRGHRDTGRLASASGYDIRGYRGTGRWQRAAGTVKHFASELRFQSEMGS
jgi:hypothetical protein